MKRYLGCIIDHGGVTVAGLSVALSDRSDPQACESPQGALQRKVEGAPVQAWAEIRSLLGSRSSLS